MRLFILSAVVWVGALIALLLYYPKYLPDGDLLLSSDFEGIFKKDNQVCTKDFGCWTCTEDGVLIVEKAGFGESTGVRLMPTEDQGSSFQWDLLNPRRFAFLEFKGRIRVEDIKKGQNPWNIARCLLYFQDLRGTRRWDYPHSAEGLSGSSPWIEFSKVFPVPDFAVSAHVLIQNSAKSGTMWIDDISLQPLRVNHQFFRDRNILLGLGAILLFVFVFTLKIWQDFGWMIPVIILVGALGVLCRQVYFEEISSVLNIRVEVLKKIGHFIVFLAMGTSSSLWLQRRSTARGRVGMSIYHAMCLFAVLALFAAVTEFLQLFTLDRTPRLTDYFIDLSGSLLGVLLGFTMTRACKTGLSKP
jgi:VanZ family protein